MAHAVGENIVVEAVCGRELLTHGNQEAVGRGERRKREKGEEKGEGEGD